MALRLYSVTVDCADPGGLASFWAAVTGYTVGRANPFFAELIDDGPEAAGTEAAGRGAARSGPRMMFIQVAEAKAAKNRMHIDLGTDDLDGEVERVLGLGAELVGRYDEWGTIWATFRDPEGNEFCIGHHPVVEASVIP